MAHADRILILGGGGHGKVVADLVRSCGHVVAGYVDANPAKLGSVVEPGGSVVVATEEQLVEVLYEAGTLPADAQRALSAVGDNTTRLLHMNRLGEHCAPALIHPSAVCSPSARLRAGTVAFAMVVVNAAAVIGRGVILNTACVIEHDCVIGDGAHVSPGAILAGGVRVGARSWVGAGATIIQGVSIGADVIVGAGAVVLRDVPDGARIAGVPARPL